MRFPSIGYEAPKEEKNKKNDKNDPRITTFVQNHNKVKVVDQILRQLNGIKGTTSSTFR